LQYSIAFLAAIAIAIAIVLMAIANALIYIYEKKAPCATKILKSDTKKNWESHIYLPICADV